MPTTPNLEAIAASIDILLDKATEAAGIVWKDVIVATDKVIEGGDNNLPIEQFTFGSYEAAIRAGMTAKIQTQNGIKYRRIISNNSDGEGFTATFDSGVYIYPGEQVTITVYRDSAPVQGLTDGRMDNLDYLNRSVQSVYESAVHADQNSGRLLQTSLSLPYYAKGFQSADNLAVGIIAVNTPFEGIISGQGSPFDYPHLGRIRSVIERGDEVYTIVALDRNAGTITVSPAPSDSPASWENSQFRLSTVDPFTARLLGRLTQDRANNLDNLDAAVSGIGTVVSGGGGLVVTGGIGGEIVLSDDEYEPITAYANDILPVSMVLVDSKGTVIDLSTYTVSALLTDDAHFATDDIPVVEITDAASGLALVTVQVPSSTGRYRLSVQRVKGMTEKVTHSAITINVVRR